MFTSEYSQARITTETRKAFLMIIFLEWPDN